MCGRVWNSTTSANTTRQRQHHLTLYCHPQDDCFKYDTNFHYHMKWPLIVFFLKRILCQWQQIVTTLSKLWRVLFLAPSVCGFCLFVYEISPERLKGFAPNSHGRRVWSRTQTSLKVKVKGWKFKVTRDKNSVFPSFRRPACSLFAKTSLASSCYFVYLYLYCRWWA